MFMAQNLALLNVGMICPFTKPTVYTQVDPLRHCQNLSPPKSPILVDFEMKRGFRGQAIYLVQSHPILGDLGGISRLKRSDEDLCVHGSFPKRGKPSPIFLPREEEAGILVSSFFGLLCIHSGI